MIQKIVNSIQKCKKCFNLKRCTQPAHLKPLEKGFKEVEIRGLETTTTFPDRICKGSIELKKDTDAFIPNTYNIYSNGEVVGYCSIGESTGFSMTGNLDRIPTSFIEKGKLKPYLEIGQLAMWDDMGAVHQNQGYGRKTMQALYELSKDLGFEGRLGLVALHEAQGFYTKVGFLDNGSALRFFEPTPDALAKLYKNSNILNVIS